MAQRSSFGVLSDIAAGITGLRNFVFNSIFVIVMVFIVLAVLVNCQGTSVPEGSALVLNLRGHIVESKTVPDPLQSLLSNGAGNAEVDINAVTTAIDAAAQDDDIKLLFLDLDELASAAPAHVERLGRALQGFKESGKKIIAYGLYFAQAQYHIASFADALYMHPMGQVVLQGFGGYQLYYKELLEKLDVNIHVFRVGEFKAAVEPFLRNDMSAEARQANEALYQNLWQRLVDDVARNRNLESTDVQDFADNLDVHLASTDGNLARAALENHLIDELLTSDESRVRVAQEVGYAAEGGDINGIDYLAYLSARGLAPLTDGGSGDKIAVIVAQGTIVNEGRGNGVIAAEPTISLIRRARFDDSVKALVVRVDSPGGSSFASELIRQELELVQLAGKPVVASFGALATSGGYWISATADTIVAEPTSITGSIGIFSFVPTFENTLARAGVHSDGVGTTALTLGLDAYGGINENMARIQQALVNQGYEQFVTLVARGRDKTPDEVKAVAEGRVWSGDVALEHGLVDALGGLDLAIETAAELAELDDWGITPLSLPRDPRDALMQQLMPSASGVLAPLVRSLGKIAELDDPNNLYALCDNCWVVPPR